MSINWEQLWKNIPRHLFIAWAAVVGASIGRDISLWPIMLKLTVPVALVLLGWETIRFIHRLQAAKTDETSLATPANVMQATARKLAQVWPTPRECPICKKHGPWSMGEFIGLNIVGRGGLVAMVPLRCDACGGVQFFNALHLASIETKEATDDLRAEG